MPAPLLWAGRLRRRRMGPNPPTCRWHHPAASQRLRNPTFCRPAGRKNRCISQPVARRAPMYAPSPRAGVHRQHVCRVDRRESRRLHARTPDPASRTPAHPRSRRRATRAPVAAQHFTIVTAQAESAFDGTDRTRSSVFHFAQADTSHFEMLSHLLHPVQTAGAGTVRTARQCNPYASARFRLTEPGASEPPITPWAHPSHCLVRPKGAEGYA